MCLLLRSGLLLSLLCVLQGVAEGPWHHSASTYRAVFEVTSDPNWRDAGYFIEVPVCGLGAEDGSSVYVFDESNRAMRVRAMGPSRDGLALIQVSRGDPSKRIFAYWGSSRRAPQYDMMPRGLTQSLRTLPEKANLSTLGKCQDLYKESKLLGILPLRQVELAGNPLTTDAHFIVDVEGMFRQERGEKVSLFVAHDGAGFLLIDGKPVIEHPGNHRAQAYRQGKGREVLPLDEGLTPLQFLLFSHDARSVGVLARYENERKKYALPESAFVQCGQTRLVSVDSSHTNRPAPAFSVEHTAYITTEDQVYTELTLKTFSGAEVLWELGDGGKAEGAEIRLIRVGLEPLTISARAEARSRDVATATTHFATVPTRHSWQNDRHRDHFSQIMLERNLPELDLATLQGYLQLVTSVDRDADSVPIAQALTAHKDFRRADNHLQIHLALARGAAADKPEVAEAAYRQTMRLTREEAVIFEYLEFLLYRQNDLEKSDKMLREATRVVGKAHDQLLRYGAEMALLSGNHDTAAEEIRAMQARLQQAGNHRNSLVQSNEVAERFRDHLAGGMLLEAEADLRALGVLAPTLYGNGYYAVLRAKLFRRLHWQEAAVRLIDQTLAFNALPAYLPDLELQKAFALSDLARHDEARAVFQRIAAQYPNHPAAETARTYLKN